MAANLPRAIPSGRARSLAVLVALTVVSSLPSLAQARCDPPPTPIVDLDMARPYTNAAGSEASADLQDRHRSEAAPLKTWLSAVAKAADTRSGAPCALSWLTAWSRAGALLGEMKSKQAEYERKWTMTGAALAYLKLAPAASRDDRASIEPWLKKLADASYRFAAAAGHKRNNHWYWLGLGLGGVALAAGDDSYWETAHAIFRDAIAEISAGGTLPMELAREKRALHYHDFALMPLVTLAELAALRGEDWYGEQGGALHRLVGPTLAGLAEPARFAALAGMSQEPPARPGSGWYALYAARFAGRIAKPLAGARPDHRWLGGDVRNLAAAINALGPPERQR